ncbi:TraM recognition domain-containing protein [Roseateles sp. BYS78W]|uniref:TraM recognition domain-containing protein n=1 Tax=Pelomonas candidula TaxID=3299025 RepID=A0ABW7HFH8_9BURK
MRKSNNAAPMADMPWWMHAFMLLLMLGGFMAMAIGKSGGGGVPAVAVMLPLGIGILIVGGILLRGLMTFRHGLLDARNKVRVDVLGDVATREKDPSLLERFISMMSVQAVGQRFYAYVLKQLGVDSEAEFGKEMLFRLGEAFKNDPSPLTRGDLKEAARKRWPMWKDELGALQGQFELHESLPSHMEPSVFMHDKLISGDPLSFYCFRYLTDADLKRAYGASLRRVQETASYVPSVAALLGVGIMLCLLHCMAGQTQSQFLGFVLALVAGAASAVGFAVWSLTTLAEKALHVKSVAAFAHHRVNSDETLRTVQSLATARAKEEQKNPAGGLTALRDSLRLALRDKNPVIQIGIGTGHALLHGVHPCHSYMEGQPVCMTTDDLSRGGVIILGATGSGKSYSILIPLMAQVMRAPFDQSEIDLAVAGKRPLTASMVTFDPKAALHHDANRLAKDAGWVSRNIGTGKNEFGLDLYDGLTPVIVCAVKSEAMAQKASGASKGDPFWDSMGAKVRYAATVIARVYELTEEGLAEVANSGDRIYSDDGVYKLAMSARVPDGRLFKVIEAIIKNVRDKEKRKYIAAYCGPELTAAIDFLRRDLMTQFSENTVGGFLANVADSMGDFISENDIRERFGSARGNILDIDRLWDNRTVTNFTLSKFRYGDVARIVTIMAKIRLYHRGALRQEMDPDIGKYSKLIAVGDECQEFVTSGGTFSEAQYINTSRAFGFSFIFATQTISALIMALGSEKAAYNMMAQLRSKVFLASEDPDTLRYLQSITPDTLQAYIQDNNAYEGVLAWRKEVLGGISENIVPADISDDDLLKQSHPLVHGRVEPLIRSMADPLGKAHAASGQEAYEAMYVHGEDWVNAYAPQGRFASFVGNALKGVVPEGLGGRDAGVSEPTMRPTYNKADMGMSVGKAIVVTNNQGLFQTDKVILTHQLGFLQNKDTIDVEVAEVAPQVTAAQKVATQRVAMAAQ